MKYSTLTSKGQVTIPIDIREKLHLVVGSKVEFIIQNNCCIVLPINRSVKDLQGFLPKPNKTLSVSEMNEIIKQVL